MKRLAAVAACALWVTAIIGAMALARALPTAAPPADVAGLRLWIAEQPPATTLVALLRVPVLVGGWYLLAVTALGAGGRLVRLRPLARLADTVTLPPLRRLLDVALGATATLVAVAGPAGAAPPVRAAPITTVPSPPPILRPFEEPETTIPVYGEEPGTPAAPGGDGAPDAAPVPEPDAGPTLPPAPAPPAIDPPAIDPSAIDPATTMATTGPSPSQGGTPLPPPVATAPSPAATSPAPSPESAPVPAAAATWTVMPGDNFWRVAERLLAGSWSRRPSIPEVARYWRTVIDANRAQLVRANDPSLVLPGQVLAVPPLPAEPRP